MDYRKERRVDYACLINHSVVNSFQFFDFTTGEMGNLVLSLKSSCIKVLNGYSSHVLKNIAPKVSLVISYILNKCVKGHSFPS